MGRTRLSPEEARAMAAARWARTTPEERRELMSEVGKLGGRPRERRRCFCGDNTMRRAYLRNFICCRKHGIVALKRDGRVAAPDAEDREWELADFKDRALRPD